MSQRGTSGLDKELRPSPLTVTRGDGWKDTDGGIVDWVSWNHLHPSSGTDVAQSVDQKRKIPRCKITSFTSHP